MKVDKFWAICALVILSCIAIGQCIELLPIDKPVPALPETIYASTWDAANHGLIEREYGEGWDRPTGDVWYGIKLENECGNTLSIIPPPSPPPVFLGYSNQAYDISPPSLDRFSKCFFLCFGRQGRASDCTDRCAAAMRSVR